MWAGVIFDLLESPVTAKLEGEGGSANVPGGTGFQSVEIAPCICAVMSANGKINMRIRFAHDASLSFPSFLPVLRSLYFYLPTASIDIHILFSASGSDHGMGQ